MSRELIQIKHYDVQADSVDANSIPWEFGPNGPKSCLQAPYEFCRKWFSEKDLRNKTILDYGCGARALSMFFLADSGAQITGVDLSPESIKKAKAIAEARELKDIVSFEIGNCEKLRFDTGYFDFIFSSGTLSCLDLTSAFTELSRVLKPDGYAVIVDTLGSNPVLNLNRYIKFKRGMKTKWSVDHILKIRDYERATSYFANLELHYFDFCSLLLLPLSRFKGRALSSAIRAAQRMDRILLSIPLFQRTAFKVVCILSKPKRRK